MNNNLNKKLLDTSLAAQRNRILEWFLNVKPRISTFEAREGLAILMPATRIFELKAEGFNIQTHRIEVKDSLGVPHKIANYVFF